MPDIQTAMKQALTKTLVDWDDEAPASPSVQPVSASVSKPSQNIQGIPMTGQPHRFGIKNNISRTTFNYIKDHPGSTRKEIIIALEHLGFNEGSTSSLISQMRKNKLIHKTGELYYADADEYKPLKNIKLVRQATPAPVEVKPKRKYTKKSEGIGALLQAKIEAASNQPPKDIPVVIDPVARKAFVSLVRTKAPEDILKDMTVFQARELYEYLKKMFGG